MVAAAPPASAGQLKGFSIDPVEGATASATYPAGSIPGTASRSTVGSTIQPTQCRTLPNCGVIPVTVNYPEGYDFENKEFALEIVLSWDQNRVVVDPNVRVGGQAPRPNTQGNDLDVYIYVKKPNASGAMVDTEIGRSNTALQPERTKVFGGFNVYDIVVSNFGGVNTGFKVDVNFIPSFIVASSAEDFEDVGNSAAAFNSEADAGDSASGDSGTSLSDRPSREPVSSRAGSADPGAILFAPTSDALPALAAGASISAPESSFGPIDAEFDNALAGNKPSATSLFDEARTAGPAKPVAAALLFFWLGIVPLALAAGVGVVLIRRRPLALSFDLAAPSTA